MERLAASYGWAVEAIGGFDRANSGVILVWTGLLERFVPDLLPSHTPKDPRVLGDQTIV